MELTGNAFAFPWEVDLMAWLQNSLPDSLISVFSRFSFFGEEAFMFLLLGFLYWSYDKRAAKKAGIVIVMICVWAPMIKNAVLRLRPYMVHEQIGLRRAIAADADLNDISAQGYSFPSQHAASVSGLGSAIAAVFNKPWLSWLTVILSLLVGVSRVIVGAHYPTDVLCGWVFGLLVCAVVSALERRITDQRLFYGLMLLTALPGLFFCKSADYYSVLGLLIGFIFGTQVEEKHVNFENTCHPVRAVLRILGGGLVFIALNTILKLPFSARFLSSGTFAALLVRCARYAVIAFVCFAVYPMVFKYTANFWKRKEYDKRA